MVWCFRTWTTICEWWNHEFCSLPKIMKKNVQPSICDLKPKNLWDVQQDNDPKQTSTYHLWLSQSEDLNLIEMLWHCDIKKAVHIWKPSNVDEVEQFSKKEMGKFLHRNLKDSLPDTANARLRLLLLNVVLPIIRFSLSERAGQVCIVFISPY